MSSRYRLHRAGQGFPFSLLTRLADSLASLSLAVVLIFTLAGTLAFATFVEARYGTASVQFFVYQTWWFDGLLILLALNILFAAMVRYPWKRYQTGFVITHIGLLTLISGAALSRLYGIDSQVIVFEDQTSKWAWGDHFKIKLREVGADRESNRLTSTKTKSESEITFNGGPMSWEDYTKKFTFSGPMQSVEPDIWKRAGKSTVNGLSGLLFGLPMRHRAGNTLFERDDIEIKVRDYFSHSEMEGPIRLRVGGGKIKEKVVDEADGTTKEVAKDMGWSETSLFTNKMRDQKAYPLGVGEKQFMGGGYFVLSMAIKDDQVKAFLDSAPKTAIGPKGAVVLHVSGKRVEFSVEEKLGKGKFPVEGTPFEIEVAKHFSVGLPVINAKQEIDFEGQPNANSPDNPVVVIKVWKEGNETRNIALLSEAPELNVYDYENGIYGVYWFDQSGRTRDERMRLQISSRIEVLHAPDQKLYYRYWNLSQVVAAGELPTTGGEAAAINAFKMPAGAPVGQLKMYVERYVPFDGPIKVPAPVEFKRDLPIAQSRPAVLLEITAKKENGETITTEKWLRAASADDPTLLRADDRLVAEGGKRQYELSMMLDAIDIGFRVRLDKFERKLDPGTSQASHFSSTIDLIDRDTFRELRFVNAKGGRVNQLKTPGCEPGAAIAVDPLRGDLFVADAKRPVIWKFRADDRGEWDMGEFTSQVSGEISALAIDSKARKLYWVEASGPQGEGALMSIDADGDGAAQRVHAFSIAPKLAALDSKGQSLYFIDPISAELNSLDLQAKKTKLVVGGLEDAVGLVAVGGDSPQIYVADQKSGAILVVEDGESKAVTRLPKDHKPISLALGPDGDSLLVGVEIATPKPVNTNKPPAERLPDAIVRVGLKDKSEVKLAQSRVYSPSAIASDPTSGQIYWIQSASLGENMWITMNAPIDVDDPHSGRSYRVFQESYNGPFLPGSEVFEELVPPSSSKDELYMSVLSVNYDPGRGIRSAGCVLVTIGVAVMFFMRAYFFTPRARTTPSPAGRAVNAQRIVSAEMVET